MKPSRWMDVNTHTHTHTHTHAHTISDALDTVRNSLYNKIRNYRKNVSLKISIDVWEKLIKNLGRNNAQKKYSYILKISNKKLINFINQTH